MPTVLRVFPRRTSATPVDDLAFIGEPDFFCPPADRVDISCTFTWDLPEVRRLVTAWGRRYPDVRLGGPALDDPGGPFVPGHFLRPGYTITTRGCPNRCPFCLVPDREGPLRCLPIKAGHIVQDNNLLAAPFKHFRKVIAMLGAQPRAARFPGGLCVHRFRPRHLDLLQTIRVRELWFAYDEAAQLADLHLALHLCRHAGLTRRKLRCYVLIGYRDDTPAAAETRLEEAWEAGALPFAMPYQPADRQIVRNGEWRRLVRQWSRPAAMFASHRAPT